MRSVGQELVTGLWKKHSSYIMLITLSAIGTSPKVTNDFIDFFHFHTVKFHYCSGEKSHWYFNGIIIRLDTITCIRIYLKYTIMYIIIM